jgi:hypothetical protein
MRLKRPMTEPNEAFTSLLLDLFDATEMRRFVSYLPGGEKLAAKLPTPPVATVVMAEAVAAVLMPLLGGDSPVWARLFADRPNRRIDIEKARSTIAQSPVAPGGHEPLIEERMAIAGSKLNTLLAGLISVPNSTSDLLNDAALLLTQGHAQIVVARQQVREQGLALIDATKRADEAAMRESGAHSDLYACKVEAERALGATSDGPVTATFELLATEHRNLKARLGTLEADLLAIRGAYLEGAGTNGTVTEIVGAVRRGADPQTMAAAVEHKLYKGHCKAGWEAMRSLSGLADYDDALEFVRALVNSTRQAFEQASGGKTPTVEDLVAAIHRGAR